MKRFNYILITIISLLISIPVYAYDYSDTGIPEVNKSDKVYDLADLFTDEEEEKLKTFIMNYIDKYDMDLVVVTTNENKETPYNGQNASTVYADDFYDYNNFGNNSTRDGSILLIDMDNRVFVITTCGTAINTYSDAYLESIYDAMDSDMGDGNYYSATMIALNKLNKGAIKKYGSTKEKAMLYVRAYWYICVIISGIITLIYGLNIKHKYKLEKRKEADFYLKDSNIRDKKDLFVTATTSRTYSPVSTGSGSSTHSSHSGMSHGGGGGHHF